MRKTYGSGYPRTLGALMAWSRLDPEAPAVTDAAGTLDRRAFQNRVLRSASAPGQEDAGSGDSHSDGSFLPCFPVAGNIASGFVSVLVGALAIVLLRAGVIFKLARRHAQSVRRDRLVVTTGATV